jgi:LPXTG-motif cell wall-anchored protein
VRKNRWFSLVAFCCIFLWSLTPGLIASANSQEEGSDTSEVVKGELNLTIETTTTLNLSTTRHTQIHLHLSNCPEEFTQIYVKIKGEWLELTQQGNSALYKALDGGEFVSDDISEFKFVTKANGEIIVPVSEIKVGVEAEGTINYWLEKCLQINEPVDPPKDENGENNKNTQIHLHLKACPQEIFQVFVKVDDEWVELKRQGKSSLFKAPDRGEYVKDDITEFKFITNSKNEFVIPVDKLKIGVEAQGTINYWLEECLEKEEPPSDEEKDPVVGDGKGENSNQPPGSKNGNEGNDGNDGNDGTDAETPTGTLPQTGEVGNLIYYVTGLALILLGSYLLFRKKMSRV